MKCPKCGKIHFLSMACPQFIGPRFGRKSGKYWDFKRRKPMTHRQLKLLTPHDWKRMSRLIQEETRKGTPLPDGRPTDEVTYMAHPQADGHPGADHPTEGEHEGPDLDFPERL